MSALRHHVDSENQGKSTTSTRSGEKKFKKRGGTTDKGKDYEHLYMAHLILRLTLDDDVENFYLSSNDEEFGDFDDVVVEIVFKDRTETYAIQLKHIDKKTPLGRAQLTAKTGKKNFSIEKYYDTFNNCSRLKQDVKMILFTNTSLNMDEAKEFDFGQLSVKFVPSEENKILNTSGKNSCCHTLKNNQDGSSKYDAFFEKFYFYTDQADVTQLDNDLREMLKKNFKCDESIVSQYLQFITQWSMKAGNKLKLDKSWMTRFITLCVLSPHVRPLAFDATRSVNEKETIFREVASKFDFSIIDERNYEKISHLWSDTINELQDLTEAGKINGKYLLFLKTLRVKEDLFRDDPLKVNKLLWLLGKCPLVVQECPQVYGTFKIGCKNVIVLKAATKSVDENNKTTLGQNVFQKLSDLKEQVELYEKILTSFTYSIEGQKETALTHLLEACEKIDSLITSDKVVEMLEGPLPIGNQKEVLPPSHVERSLTKILIDLEFLKRNSKKSVIFVSSVANFKSFKNLLPDIKINEISNMNERESMKLFDCGQVYISKKHFSLKECTALFKKNAEVEVHHFRYFNKQYLEWISSEHSQGQRFNELKKFCLNDEFNVYTLHQSQLFSSGEQDVNIFCAEPGMGKSTLMKSLKTNTSSAKWTIVIYARNHFTHFRENGADVVKFKEYIFTNVRKKCSNIDQQVFKAMLERNNIQVIWDGLDEVTDATLEAILTLVQTLAESGVQQWLTARNNLKTKLENRLGSFSRNIKQFDAQEQREYLKERLELPADDLTATFIKIKKNLMSFPNYKILGIPLQIYMLTELFSKDKEKYLNLLDSVFTVLDLYRHFVDEKFKVFYQEKNKFDLSVERMFQKFEDEKEAKINCYKTVAARSYLEDLSVTNIDVDFEIQLKYFLQEIENGGDAVGFICQIASNGGVEFSHNSYGEYFAALYLFETYPSTARDTKFVSDGRYNNIRFFLDLMLCKNSKGFISVVYKNPLLLDECTELDLNEKDCIGRDILEVTCARSKNYRTTYSKAKTIITRRGKFATRWVVAKGDTGDLDYIPISEAFCKISTSIDIRTKKLLLFFPFLISYYETRYTDQNYLRMILYYAIRFDFVVIFEYVEHYPKLKEAFNGINFGSILTVAMYYRSQRILEKLFLNEQSYYNIPSVSSLRLRRNKIDEIFVYILLNIEIRLDIPNSEGQFLTHYACEKNLHKTLKLLNAKNVKWDTFDANGGCAIHNACTKKKMDVLKSLIRIGCDINVPDANGYFPIHYACQNLNEKQISFLVTHGAELNVPSPRGWMPLHLMCEEGCFDMAKLLMLHGADLNVLDGQGRLPIHYICEKGNVEMVKLMVTNGAKVDVPDKNGKFPIHYMCKFGNVHMVELLVMNGAKFDVADVDSRLPIHYACENYSDTVRLLIKENAKTDIPDRYSKLPIHYMCEQGAGDIVELLIKTDKSVINVADANNFLLLPYACENRYFDLDLDVLELSGCPPLHYAIDSGKLDLVNFLVANGAKVDFPDEKALLLLRNACVNKHVDTMIFLLENGTKVNDQLQIHFVCRKGYLDVLKVLIAYDMKIDAPDGFGILPLHCACVAGDVDIVNLLLAKGAEVNIPDSDGNLPMHFACLNNEFGSRIISLLLEKNASVNVPSAKGYLPIHFASGLGSRIIDLSYYFRIENKINNNVLRMLVELDASLNTPNPDDLLPIHSVCESGEIDMVKLLVSNGTNVNASDARGRLPIHYACESTVCTDEILSFLIKKGASVNAADVDRVLPIHVACAKSSLHTVKLLIAHGADIYGTDKNGRLPFNYAYKNRLYRPPKTPQTYLPRTPPPSTPEPCYYIAAKFLSGTGNDEKAQFQADRTNPDEATFPIPAERKKPSA
ncbi:uncharacterized protein LOC135137984 [Zophobas morio]|uniref:uncharacterized protein LOC135137984 n=1 Tax=Zophobas morio TaxID=2755281 RepID=UPI00308271AC